MESSVMFSEELGKLRVGLVDAQNQALVAEREQARLAGLAAQERNRAETAEELVKQQHEEIQQLRYQLSQVRTETAQIPNLLAERSELSSQVRDLTEKLTKSQDDYAACCVELNGVHDELSELTAETVTLRAELDPTRDAIAAFKAWHDAQDRIARQLNG